MRKIIIIGECTLDILFPQQRDTDIVDLKAIPGGRLLNAAAMLGDAGYNVTYVSECARDLTGDMLVDFLKRHNVETRSIDRYTDGITPLNLRFEPDDTIIGSRDYPKERFDVVWPRIDNDDIVVFGTYFSLDRRVRPQVVDLLNHAAERKALIIYVPGLSPAPDHGITKLMPDILENLEMASVVMTRSSDLATIFNADDVALCYARHIRFYCDTFINIDAVARKLDIFYRDSLITEESSSICDTLHANAGALAGTVAAMCDNDVTLGRLSCMAESELKAIVSAASEWAIGKNRVK
ncbi:MAG: carbohydrate kinase family protein [Paramuribaculum sp.]|nr:carbohydrate kinase family protein [Paramuribaculum sp.]